MNTVALHAHHVHNDSIHTFQHLHRKMEIDKTYFGFGFLAFVPYFCLSTLTVTSFYFTCIWNKFRYVRHLCSENILLIKFECNAWLPVAATNGEHEIDRCSIPFCLFLLSFVKNDHKSAESFIGVTSFLMPIYLSVVWCK